MSRTDKLSIGALSFSQCRCGGTRWVRPLQLRTTHGRTRLATGLRPGWEPSQHASNTLVDLGPFSVPVFLIKGELHSLASVLEGSSILSSIFCDVQRCWQR